MTVMRRYVLGLGRSRGRFGRPDHGRLPTIGSGVQPSSLISETDALKRPLPSSTSCVIQTRK